MRTFQTKHSKNILKHSQKSKFSKIHKFRAGFGLRKISGTLYVVCASSDLTKRARLFRKITQGASFDGNKMKQKDSKMK